GERRAQRVCAGCIGACSEASAANARRRRSHVRHSHAAHATTGERGSARKSKTKRDTNNQTIFHYPNLSFERMMEQRKSQRNSTGVSFGSSEGIRLPIRRN